MTRLILPILAALAFAPSALAWTPISQTPLSNIDRPATLLTSAGTELVVWSDNGSGLWLWSSKGGTKQIATVPFVAQPQVVQQPSGAVQLYAGSGGGVVRFQSTDDGATWSGPFAIVSPTTTGPVVSAAVRPDGTPMFTQDSTSGVNVFQGLDGEQSHTVFGTCCGYAETLAVDRSNYAQVAFWSNASAFPNLFVYEGLDGSGAQAGPGRSFGAPQTAPRNDSVPLVAAGDGTTYMGWAAGYPTATAFAVNAFQGGNLGWSSVVAGGRFAGADPHLALAADRANRLWAVWSQGNAVHARRSRSRAHHFGAPSAAGLAAATVYQLAAIALPDGRVDAFFNDGHQIVHQALLPGLTVTAAKKTATVLDDGIGVKATLKGGGHTVTTSAAGKASLAKFRRGTHVTVTAGGYAAASFKVP
ncbi:MAG TPA: hypothetical protein VHC67_01565 [Gaiellaceae bacterium]|nr:hypothetical protein [Gaiellaceae bacterium]